MLEKAKLGTRFVCFECQCKFYDLNREVPTCPDCGADQREAPHQELRMRSSKRKAAPKPAPVPELDDDDDDDDSDDDEDDLLLDDMDDDDDDDDE